LTLGEKPALADVLRELRASARLSGCQEAAPLLVSGGRFLDVTVHLSNAVVGAAYPALDQRFDPSVVRPVLLVRLQSAVTPDVVGREITDAKRMFEKAGHPIQLVLANDGEVRDDAADARLVAMQYPQAQAFLEDSERPVLVAANPSQDPPLPPAVLVAGGALGAVAAGATILRVHRRSDPDGEGGGEKSRPKVAPDMMAARVKVRAHLPWADAPDGALL